ncbi:MAG: HAD family hydrolase [Gemmatimonadota bacterium]|jgi:D-glycero-D-manno-heptose 1,7-bisphosphate phosphatase
MREEPSSHEGDRPETKPVSRRAVFLDRDGTLIQERDYLADPEGVSLLPGVPEALRLLAEGGFALVVVTNQSGIARGLYTLDDYHAVAHQLDEELRRTGVDLDATYFCPHHPEFTGPCECRKPNTGMYVQAARELGLDLSDSYFVGDRQKDVVPAATLGGTGILVRTGYGLEEEVAVGEGTIVVDSLLDAARLILSAG